MKSKIEQGAENRDAVWKATSKIPLSADVIAEKTGLKKPTVARHLRAFTKDGKLTAFGAEDDKRVVVYARA